MTLSAYPYIPTHHDVNVSFTGSTSSGNASVHYIEAGHSTLPTLILYHGFPSSSYQYRDFIPILASDYHVLAPDFPGFGLTTVASDFNYTFDNLAAVTSAWLDEMEVENYGMYIFDYGAPIGMRVALEHPEKVKAIVSQNGNAYVEGFGRPFWQPVFDLWNSSNSAAARDVLIKNVLTLETTEYQYTAGFPEKDLVLRNPESWHFDYLQNVAGSDNQKHQLDLFYDYRTNVEQYPKWQQYFRSSGVPILAVWGKNDPAFIYSGAKKFEELPNAMVRFVDAGHFALETKRWEIARIMKGWLSGIGY